MIIWNLDPVLLSVGPLEIRWYGLVYALGFLLGYWVLHKAAIIPKKAAEDYILLLAMGSILVARLFYVLFYNPAYYLSNPAQIPAVWSGGLSIHGGIVGAVLITWWFARKHKVNPYRITDAIVTPLAFVLIFGRLANYANGELPGRITDVGWCVVFPGVEGCRHPSQLYEALYSYALFWILFLMGETKKWSAGVLTWSFITLYGALRFAVTFLRDFDPTDPGVLGLSIGQWLSLVMVLAGLAWFAAMRRTGHPLQR